MKTRNTNLIVIVGLILFCSWSAKETSEINKCEWLIGTWENKTPKGSVFETWIKSGEKELSGKSYIVKESDTIVFETIRLIQEQEGLFYIPSVKDQNDGAPVRFISKIFSDTQMVFENSAHDFPKVISYTKISADSLVAEISGAIKGKERKQTFPMKRVSSTY
jgi:Domain of unknown function (DUF6265)